MYENAKHMRDTIDQIPYGGATWYSVSFQYTGPVDDTSPRWKRDKYIFHYEDALEFAEAMLASPDFDGKFDYIPFEEYVPSRTGQGRVRRFCNQFSGQWAYKKAVSLLPHR